MNQPHKHAAIIKAWADGALVQFRPMASVPWCDIEEPIWETGYEYRIKPEPEYPKTRMSDEAMCELHDLRDVANTAIKQAIIDGDVIINPNKQ